MVKYNTGTDIDKEIKLWIKSTTYCLCICGRQCESMNALYMHIKDKHIKEI